MRRLVPSLTVLLALAACSLFQPPPPHYLVFFPQASAELDGAARQVIALAAQRAQARPGSSVEVAGYTDSAGSATADVALSKQRAQIVADTLVADGVDAGRIVRTGRGQTGEDPGVASRRVEINLGG